MRMASKSAIGFARSKGLERNKVILGFLRKYAPRGRLSNQSLVVGRSSLAKSLDPQFQEQALWIRF
jgi:hypothetical protein